MPRLRFAFVVALALHGVLLLVRPRAKQSTVSPGEVARSEQLFEIESSAPEPAPPVPPSESPVVASLGAVPPPRAAARSAPHLVQTPSTELGAGVSVATEGEPGSATSPGDASPTGAAQPERAIDLGLDGHFFMRPPSEDLPRIRKPEFQRQMDRSLLMADVRRGLARGNALLGSLNNAVRAEGPIRGEALFQVTVGADGGLTGVQVVQGSASEWAAVLSAFRELVARKRVRVPPGARGLRVTFSVKAKVQRPSGKEVQGSAVGVDGVSANPNGVMLNGDFDVADLGGGGQRLVYARVVSEDLL